MEIVSIIILCYRLVLLVLLSFTEICVATDILHPFDTLSDGQTLISSTQRFELGFFSPGNSKNRYLGIWYYNQTPQTVIWVANRENPLNDSSGILKIGDHGNLILLNQTEKVVWSTTNNSNTQIEISSKTATIAQILDSGNLVLRIDGNTEEKNYLWQSFDFPCDTLMARMKLGRDTKLTSWKSPEDPSPGEFSAGFEYRGFPQVFIRKGPVKLCRTGPWDGMGFSGSGLLPTFVSNPKVITDSEKQYFQYYALHNDSIITRFVLSYIGSGQRYVWNNISLEWFVLSSHPSDLCENYGQCGPNSICTINDPRICGCLPGYEPRSSQDGEMLVSSIGCVSKHPLNCSLGEGFLKLERVKIPDFLEFWMNDSMSLKDCEAECLKNCSCTAYANSDPTGAQSGGCLLWFGDLVDIRRLANSSKSGNQNFHLRVTAHDLELYSESRKKRRMVLVIVATSVASVVLLIALCFILKRKLQKQGGHQDSQANVEESLELPLLSFVTISEATNNFSDSNKIGEGGFGPVYKGKLSTGQEIAVKRLSENSQQGLLEFKNEVILIAKLQHRNLVRLLGCCIQGEERMLIYEYLPNGSLNSFIFDDKRSNSLAWRVRFNIILGIARGIVYLHQDSRLRIIHRDLKASNVLLDNEMNPKISDFGIARAFGGDQLLAKTRRVVGTFGYMSPEYVTNGLFSMKSDVFSFGVLLLEIVSGKRNREYCYHGFDLSLLGHAWRLYTEGKDVELMDALVGDSCSISEVKRSIQIGLLCVQHRPQDRPTMSSVLLMLVSETAILPQPNQPGFYTSPNDETQHPLVGKQSTTNTISITLLRGR